MYYLKFFKYCERFKFPFCRVPFTTFMIQKIGPRRNTPFRKIVNFSIRDAFCLTMTRKHLTNGKKLKIVHETTQRLANGESLKSVARAFAVYPSQIRQWRAKVVQLAQSKRSKKCNGKEESIEGVRGRFDGLGI